MFILALLISFGAAADVYPCDWNMDDAAPAAFFQMLDVPRTPPEPEFIEVPDPDIVPTPPPTVEPGPEPVIDPGPAPAPTPEPVQDPLPGPTDD